MIRFSLACGHGHDFDGWFRNNEDFETQKERGLVSCPVCNSASVDKALMAPSVATARGKEKMTLARGEEQSRMMAQIRRLADEMRANSEHVGDRFADEARKIHFGESEARSIHGEATAEEARSLAEDGVAFLPLPVLPEERN